MTVARTAPDAAAAAAEEAEVGKRLIVLLAGGTALGEEADEGGRSTSPE